MNARGAARADGVGKQPECFTGTVEQQHFVRIAAMPRATASYSVAAVTVTVTPCDVTPPRMALIVVLPGVTVLTDTFEPVALLTVATDCVVERQVTALVRF